MTFTSCLMISGYFWTNMWLILHRWVEGHQTQPKVCSSGFLYNGLWNAGAHNIAHFIGMKIYKLTLWTQYRVIFCYTDGDFYNLPCNKVITCLSILLWTFSTWKISISHGDFFLYSFPLSKSPLICYLN